jgi:hypothetical protein
VCKFTFRSCYSLFLSHTCHVLNFKTNMFIHMCCFPRKSECPICCEPKSEASVFDGLDGHSFHNNIISYIVQFPKSVSFDFMDQNQKSSPCMSCTANSSSSILVSMLFQNCAGSTRWIEMKSSKHMCVFSSFSCPKPYTFARLLEVYPVCLHG